jgi:hypothetical protein
MNDPQPGDMLLRGNVANGFSVVGALTNTRICGPVPLSRAIQIARGGGPVTIWQQLVDDRGCPLGRPLRLVHPD